MGVLMKKSEAQNLICHKMVRMPVPVGADSTYFELMRCQTNRCVAWSKDNLVNGQEYGFCVLATTEKLAT